MTPWTEREIERAMKRAALLVRRGMTPDQAEKVVDCLVDRDRDGDDRRMCIECSNWQASRTCFKRMPTSFDQLARCAGFQWQAP